MFGERADGPRAKVRDKTNVEDRAPIGQLADESRVVDCADAVTNPVRPEGRPKRCERRQPPHLADMRSKPKPPRAWRQTPA